MITNLENSKIIYELNGVVGRQIYSHENFEYLHLRFSVGSKTEPHIQNIIMVFFLIKGQAKLIVNGEENFVNAGQLVEIESGKERQWLNIGDEVLEILVGKFL